MIVKLQQVREEPEENLTNSDNILETSLKEWNITTLVSNSIFKFLYPNLSSLVPGSLILPASMVDSERAFSLMNRITTVLRNLEWKYHYSG